MRTTSDTKSADPKQRASFWPDPILYELAQMLRAEKDLRRAAAAKLSRRRVPKSKEAL